VIACELRTPLMIPKEDQSGQLATLKWHALTPRKSNAYEETGIRRFFHLALRFFRRYIPPTLRPTGSTSVSG
jgi:hypothetical protein